jgi:large repetitive protein
MTKASRAMSTGSAVGVSVLTVGTLVQLVGGTAAAATHPAAQSALSAAHAGLAARPAIVPATARADGGCTEETSPSYGCGKLTAFAQPVPATYPTGQTPDLAGLTIDIGGPVANDDTLYQGGTSTCITASNPNTGFTSCPESYEGVAPDPANPPNTVTGTWVSGEDYTVAVDTSGTNEPIPANTLIPGIAGTFVDCTAYQDNDGIEDYGFSGCPDAARLMAYGTYHYIAAHVTNTASHKGVAKATYALCSATATTPTVGTTSCPTGSAVLAKATTNAKGALLFPSMYVGSANYSIVPTKEPKGYQAGKSQHLIVPVVTTPAQAGTVITASAELTPTTTTLATHSVKTTENTKVTINAFTGAKNVAGPLRLVKLGNAKHGKVSYSGSKITYTPDAGFTGKDTFTYTVRNAVGVTSIGKIVVTVKA